MLHQTSQYLLWPHVIMGQCVAHMEYVRHDQTYSYRWHPIDYCSATSGRVTEEDLQWLYQIIDVFPFVFVTQIIFCSWLHAKFYFSYLLDWRVMRVQIFQVILSFSINIHLRSTLCQDTKKIIIHAIAQHHDAYDRQFDASDQYLDYIIINQSSISRQYFTYLDLVFYILLDRIKSNRNDMYWCELDWWDRTTMSFLAILQMAFLSFYYLASRLGLKQLCSYSSTSPCMGTCPAVQQCYSQSHYHPHLPMFFPIFQFLQYITACDNAFYLSTNKDLSDPHITRTITHFGWYKTWPFKQKMKMHSFVLLFCGFHIAESCSCF